MWNNLGKHLRAGLVLSIILVIAAAVASFTLSFIALREVAGNTVTGWSGYAWVFPVFVDIGLIASEVTLLTLSMMTGTGLQQLLAAGAMLLFGALTVYYNATRVPEAWRLVTGAPPVGGIVLTLLFAMLLKAFANHTGVAWRQQGAPQPYSMMGAPGGMIQGAMWRPDVPPAYWQMPSLPTSGYPQTGHPALGEDQAGEARRTMMRAYLAGLSPDQSGRATGSSIVKAMKAVHVDVNDREARRVLEEWKASSNGAR